MIRRHFGGQGLGNDLCQDVHAFLDVLLGDDEGWHHAHDVALACCDDDEARLQGCSHNGSRGLHKGIHIVRFLKAWQDGMSSMGFDCQALSTWL